MKHLFKDTKLLSILSISFKDLRNYQLDIFKMNLIKNLNSKIIFGSLFDKPQFILLNLYKKDFQKICSFSDGFTFHPMPKPDFNFCDTYYSMCDEEKYLINRNGGEIKRSVNVGIIRAIRKTHNNISEKLRYKIKGFNNVVTVCTFQGDETDRTKINKSLLGKSICEILNHFLNEVYTVSQYNQNILFLIKEKRRV